MKQSIGYIALVVRDYDEAIEFYVNVLGFRLVEDTVIAAQNKRGVLIAPPGSTETKLVLARAVGPEQSSRIGNRAGGRVSLVLHTDDFWRDYRELTSRGVIFVRNPTEETYGTAAVFKDLYGLGPVSVSPDRQRQGFGSQLMERALDELRQLGAAGCVVLGYPDFCGRFGFNVVPELILPDVPPEFFQAIAFGTETPAGTVAYHAAFDATSRMVLNFHRPKTNKNGS